MAERTIAQIERMLAVPIESAIVPSMVKVASEADRERVREVVRDVVYPADRAFLEALRGDYLAATREEPGLWSAPERRAAVPDRDPQLDDARPRPRGGPPDRPRGARVDRGRAPRSSPARPGFGDDTAAYRAALDADPATRPQTKDELVARATEDIERAMAAAPRYFGVLPRAACEVRPVEEYKEKDAPFAYYYPPAPDGSRPGIYYANGYDLPSRKYTKLATTTYHEAVPGHHFQITLEMENPHLNTFRRLGARMVGGAYVEGWGLYSERLADEMGLFRDERERFGMLDAQAWRAARLVVDTGLHALRWPRQRSIDFLQDGRPVRDRRGHRDRPLHRWPGQALTYKIGQREIERLRAELTARDGSAFDLRAFHDAVLGHGSLPLATLSRELPNWLATPGLSRHRPRDADRGLGVPQVPDARVSFHASLRPALLRDSCVIGADRDDNRVDAAPSPMARWPGSRSAMRNDRLADRAAKPQHEDSHGHRARRPPTPALRRETQTALYQRALRTLPGGTDSNFRAWGDDTIYVDRGKGGRVWDIDGNEYVDLRMGYGPVILGHGDERVDDYVNERMRKGVSFSLTSEDEVQAMELVKELTGWVDKARMTVSGTEATMHAMRVARAYTGRDKIVKFEGQYHGVHDYALISVAPERHGRARRRRRPGPPGLGPGHPGRGRRHDHPGPLQRHRRAAPAVRARGEEIAAIIVEPVLGNAQGIMPKPGFHQAMRALTEEFGILLIFDEVKTGFRFARGGAAEYFGITPDLATYAKAMGNGYPAAAFGGREEVMSVLPDKVSHGGTYAGNRVAAAAAVKTLEILRDTDALDTIHATGRRVQDGLREVLNPTGLPYDFTGHPSMFGIMFTEVEATEYRDWATTDHELYDAIAVGMHARGAMPEPDSREPWFLCEAHAAGRHRRPGRDDLHRLARRGARGPRPRRDRPRTDTVRWRTRAPDERTGRDGPRRQRRPVGRPGGGPAARPRREPGRGRA